MDPNRWRELKQVHPIDRVRLPMPSSARRSPPDQKHRRTGPQRDTIGLIRTHSQVALNLHTGLRAHRRAFEGSPNHKVWHTTQRPPWVKRAENRARNRRARQARRTNR